MSRYNNFFSSHYYCGIFVAFRNNEFGIKKLICNTQYAIFLILTTTFFHLTKIGTPLIYQLKKLVAPTEIVFSMTLFLLDTENIFITCFIPVKRQISQIRNIWGIIESH